MPERSPVNLRRRRTSATAAAAVVAAIAAAPVARAQTRYAEAPTGGLNLPTVPLTGGRDAVDMAVNPAELWFVRGPHIDLGLDAASTDNATSAGTGFGMYFGGTLGHGPFALRGFGVGLEFLRPPGKVLSPNPGNPTRLTIASAFPLWRHAAFGVAYHHFYDGDRSLDGVDSWDLGVDIRLNAYLAAGGVVRDLTQPIVFRAPAERRYELELATRPLGTNRLELAAGGQVGEIRGDLDGWLRWSWKIIHGLYFRGELLTRRLYALETPDPTLDVSKRDYRLTAGFTVSLGGLGVTALGSGGIVSGGDAKLRGGTVLMRLSQEQDPSILGPLRRIQRVELNGQQSDRQHVETVETLREAARDPGVVAVFVQIDGFRAGWADAQEIRGALLADRAGGKRVFAYITTGGTLDYFLASAAEKVYVDPAGGIRLDGFASTAIYLKDLFDKIGVHAQFEKIKEYKSAPEMFTRSGPSAPALRMRNDLYDSIYAQIVAGIARARRLKPEEVRKLIDAGPYTAGDLAKMPSLVDAVASPDAVNKRVAKALGGAYPVMDAPPKMRSRWQRPGIAVIYLDGDIVDGKSRTVPFFGKLVGGDTIAAAIAAARRDSSIRAIVLRINSPGGSALASEVISRQVFKTRKVKPIICSMGDVAASGGYFSAAGCDVIFAEPTTITGSIGIFSGKFDVSGLLSRLGITWLTVKRGKRADIDSMFRPYTPAEQKLILQKLYYFYGRFVGAVARGRGLTRAAVNKVGRGHVWTGAQARPIRLVDRFGGFGAALRYAKRKAGIAPGEPVRLVALPRQPSFLERILGRLFGGAAAGRAAAVVVPIPGADRLLRAIPGSVWADPQSPQARLPFAILWSD